jgi:hypothetical protein
MVSRLTRQRQSDCALLPHILCVAVFDVFPTGRYKLAAAQGNAGAASELLSMGLG